MSAVDLESSIEVISPTRRRVSRDLIDRIIASGDFTRLARVQVHRENGQIRGFRVLGVRRGSVLDRLGLQSGDTINAINDLELTNPDRLLTALPALRSEGHITVTLTRRAQQKTLSFDIR